MFDNNWIDVAMNLCSKEVTSDVRQVSFLFRVSASLITWSWCSDYFPWGAIIPLYCNKFRIVSTIWMCGKYLIQIFGKIHWNWKWTIDKKFSNGLQTFWTLKSLKEAIKMARSDTYGRWVWHCSTKLKNLSVTFLKHT